MAVVYPTEPGTYEPAPSAGSRLVSFAEQHLVLAGGILLALAILIGFVINKFKGSSTPANSSPSDGTNGQQTLYVPTSNTYLNYYQATDSNNNTTTTNNPPGPPGPTGPPGPAGPPGPSGTPPTTNPTPPAQQPPGGKPEQFVTVETWKPINPPWDSTLGGIAKHEGMTLQQLLALPDNAKYRAHPDKVKKGDQVEIAAATSGGSGGGFQAVPMASLEAGSGGGVPFYSAADSGSDLLGNLGYGSSVPLVSGAPQNGFYQANYYGQVGFIPAGAVTGLN